jgi:hypothetical protein
MRPPKSNAVACQFSPFIFKAAVGAEMVRAIKVELRPHPSVVESTVHLDKKELPIAIKAIQMRGGTSFDIIAAGTWHRIFKM